MAEALRRCGLGRRKMLRVISCLGTQHNPWLVLLAAIVCLVGGWVGFRLFGLGAKRVGRQRFGWTFLAAVATGASVWCTHFIAMLAYEIEAPYTFEPVLTMISLLIVIAGAAVAFQLANRDGFSFKVAAGGLLGLAISAMHYSGMAAYHVEGFVYWDASYIIASVLLAVAWGVGAMLMACANRANLSLAMYAIAVVSLHFTGMAAVTVDPFLGKAANVDPAAITAMAVAVAGVVLLIVGTGLASYIIDTDTAEKNVETLRQMALSDALTGMPNRASFGACLENELIRAKAGGHHLAVIGIDLDKFKEINDIRGHDAGDQALQIIGLRLMDSVREGEFTARIGGDEFAAIKAFKDLSDLREFVSRLESRLLDPIYIQDFEILVGGSIGISVYPNDGATAARLVSNADLAMYRAKADVHRSVCYYEPEMDEAARARRDMALELRQAIAHDQLELHYQVQEHVARRGEVAGYEVLLRWKHPVHGFVPPDQFIPLAEESGTILQIGEWVLRKACEQAASWAVAHKIAVNISAVQLTHADLPKLVHQVLLDTGLAASRLELEITETSIIQDKQRSLHALRLIKALGVTIAIDDFGTGYSSLDTLRSFPFDRIKLDRSFMHQVEDSPQAKAIVRAVLALGHSLDISVLAEGVETERQLELLKREGCPEAQGYLLGRPQPLVNPDAAAIQAA